jgi:AraC-like DNA-binding protein
VGVYAARLRLWGWFLAFTLRNMDALASLLDGPRARGAFLIRALMDPPWSVRVQDHAPLTLLAILRGEAWVVPDGRKRASDAVRLGTRDVAIVRGPDPYTVADDPVTPPQAVIHEGQRCTTPRGEDLHTMELGVRTWGNNPNGSTEMLVGTYRMHGEVSRRLLDALPGVLVLPEAVGSPFLAMLGDEMIKDEPGQAVVLDRLIDVLLIAVVRTWFSRPEAEVPAWYQALSDPLVGRALRALHNNPTQPWTVSMLAASVGASRATLARRFTELVGEPPMTYLTGWRLALAADLLCEPDSTIGEVAQRVGYSSAFALSTAFKRERGISPQEHRDRASAIDPPTR